MSPVVSWRTQRTWGPNWELQSSGAPWIPWFHIGTLSEPSVRDFASRPTGAQGGGDDDDEDECYFPFAIGIPGMNHVVHNLSADIDHRLTWWPRFWEGLRTVAALLTNDQRRKRVWKNCVKDSTYADMERNFMKGVPKLYMKRWGMIIAFINHVRPLLLVLRRTWSQAAYQGRGPEDAARESETAALAGGGEEAEISNIIMVIIAVTMIRLFVLI